MKNQSKRPGSVFDSGDEVVRAGEEVEFWRDLIERWWIDHTERVPEAVWEALVAAEWSDRE